MRMKLTGARQLSSTLLYKFQQPSSEDIAPTRRLRVASELLGIRVLDHVILGDGKHYSFVDAGSW
jgi:DNA repair protein RadC